LRQFIPGGGCDVRLATRRHWVTFSEQPAKALPG
jgi:hypothetical protein